MQVFGKKVAVQRLSLSMKTGEITALLGHNGAGQETLSSLIWHALQMNFYLAPQSIRHERGLRQILAVQAKAAWSA